MPSLDPKPSYTLPRERLRIIHIRKGEGGGSKKHPGTSKNLAYVVSPVSTVYSQSVGCTQQTLGLLRRLLKTINKFVSDVLGYF